MTQTSKSETDAALATLRAMVAIADATVEHSSGRLTLTQFRTLRAIAERTPVTMSQVAAELDINPSSVTRACEKLVAEKLIHRAQNPLNKRETLLAPTAAGHSLVNRVDHDRRQALGAVLERLDPSVQDAVIPVFEAFAEAALHIHPDGTGGQ
ncbi:MarR family winged helix-turn-helix transcriptional regulator [Amycolatopsis pithecellobii]|uniref:MarR family winged helix-turn-helix transcriptional regulator n=1 Tax=Amycolatopsis pithecellobii TaxID=664692 RepID=UPI0028AC9504|nr:MarR family transcriptional regulator [Amycolatopsis pithecellobii]